MWKSCAKELPSTSTMGVTNLPLARTSWHDPIRTLKITENPFGMHMQFVYWRKSVEPNHGDACFPSLLQYINAYKNRGCYWSPWHSSSLNLDIGQRKNHRLLSAQVVQSDQSVVRRNANGNANSRINAVASTRRVPHVSIPVIQSSRDIRPPRSATVTRARIRPSVPEVSPGPFLRFGRSWHFA